MKVFAAVTAVAILASESSAQCTEAERRQIEQFDRAWGDATTRGDKAALESMIAPDFQGASPIGTVSRASTVDGAVQAAERARANPGAAPKVSFDNYVITCTPNTATVTHRNVVTSIASGREQTTYSRSVHTFEKRGGALGGCWKRWTHAR